MCSCFSTQFERYHDIISLKNENKINEKVCKNFPEETVLIKLMIKKDINERPSAEQILNSELFKKSRLLIRFMNISIKYNKYDFKDYINILI